MNDQDDFEPISSMSDMATAAANGQDDLELMAPCNYAGERAPGAPGQVLACGCPLSEGERILDMLRVDWEKYHDPGDLALIEEYEVIMGKSPIGLSLDYSPGFHEVMGLL